MVWYDPRTSQSKTHGQGVSSLHVDEEQSGRGDRLVPEGLLGLQLHHLRGVQDRGSGQMLQGVTLTSDH